MTFIARREASQANNTHLLGVATTVTVYTYPTANANPQNSGPTIPVAAIVGGVVAGMLLAVMVSAGWVCWGKSIRRSAAKRQREAVSPIAIYNKDQDCSSSPSRKHFTKRDSTRFRTLQRRSLEYKHTSHSSLVLQKRRSDLQVTMMEKCVIETLTIGGRRKCHYHPSLIVGRMLHFLHLHWCQKYQNRSYCAR
jgi:hypothetical protein